MTPGARKALRTALFAGPLLIGAAGLLLVATRLGGYEATWRLGAHLINFLTPELTPISLEPPKTVEISLYQLNNAGRKLAHVFLYLLLGLVSARLFQWGEARLRVRTVLGVPGICLLVTGAESLVRLRSFERHVRWDQLWLNLVGSLLALGCVVLFFGIKALERRLNDEDGGREEIAPAASGSTEDG